MSYEHEVVESSSFLSNDGVILDFSRKVRGIEVILGAQRSMQTLYSSKSRYTFNTQPRPVHTLAPEFAERFSSAICQIEIKRIQYENEVITDMLAMATLVGLSDHYSSLEFYSQRRRIVAVGEMVDLEAEEQRKAELESMILTSIKVKTEGGFIGTNLYK